MEQELTFTAEHRQNEEEFFLKKYRKNHPFVKYQSIEDALEYGRDVHEALTAHMAEYDYLVTGIPKSL